MQVASLGRVTELEVDRPTESTYLLGIDQQTGSTSQRDTIRLANANRVSCNS